MNSKLNKASTVLFYAALIIAEIAWMFTKVKYIMDIRSILIYITIALLTICCIIQSQHYKRKTLLLIISLILVLLIGTLISSSKNLLILLLFCLASKNINLEKLINFNWKYLSVLMAIVLICYFAGATDVYMMYRADGTVRSSMGFSHPNTFGAYLFATFCQFLYSTHKKIPIVWHFAIGLALAYAVSFFADSRGSAYSLIIVLILSAIAKTLNNKTQIKASLSRLFSIIPIFLTLVSLIFSLSYTSSNTFMYSLNKILTTRISSANQISKEYDIKLFGQDLELVSTEEAKNTGKKAMVLDNAYMKLLYQYGALPSIVFIFAYCYAIKYAIQKKNWMLLTMLLTFAVRGLTENIMFYLYANIFLLFFSYNIYDDKPIIAQNRTSKLDNKAEGNNE